MGQVMHTFRLKQGNKRSFIEFCSWIIFRAQMIYSFTTTATKTACHICNLNVQDHTLNSCTVPTFLSEGVEPVGNVVMKKAIFTVETISAGMGEVLVYVEDPAGHREEVRH